MTGLRRNRQNSMVLYLYDLASIEVHHGIDTVNRMRILVVLRIVTVPHWSPCEPATIGKPLGHEPSKGPQLDMDPVYIGDTATT